MLGTEIATNAIGSTIGNVAADIAMGTATSVATKKVESAINDSPSTLDQIHTVLIELKSWLESQQIIGADIYQFQTIPKPSVAPPYLPKYKGDAGRTHLLIFSAIAVTLNVTSPGLGNFNFALPAATWTVIDFPDGTSYLLDPATTPNTIQIWERETNQSVFK